MRELKINTTTAADRNIPRRKAKITTNNVRIYRNIS